MIQPSLKTQSEWVEFMRTILAGHYVFTPLNNGIRCLSQHGIADEGEWTWTFNTIKQHFGDQFLEVFHHVNHKHQDFIVYLRVGEDEDFKGKHDAAVRGNDPIPRMAVPNEQDDKPGILPKATIRAFALLLTNPSYRSSFQADIAGVFHESFISLTGEPEPMLRRRNHIVSSMYDVCKQAAGKVLDKLIEDGISCSNTQDELDEAEQHLKRKIYEGVGAASMCWQKPEGAGVFDDQNATKVAESILKDVKEYMHIRTAFTTPQAVKHLVNILAHDKGYYETWKSNIAMSYVDAYNDVEGQSAIANKAAASFLRNLMAGTDLHHQHTFDEGSWNDAISSAAGIVKNWNKDGDLSEIAEKINSLSIATGVPGSNVTEGVHIIMTERIEQVLKHGYNTAEDAKKYRNGELVLAALYALTMRDAYYPRGWDKEFKKKLISKDREGRLAIAGALIAAQIDADRYNSFVKEMTKSTTQELNKESIPLKSASIGAVMNADESASHNGKPWLEPSQDMWETPEFNAIWRTIINWDIHVPNAYTGYQMANGNHVRAILDSLLETKSALTKQAEKDVWAMIAQLKGRVPDTYFDSLVETGDKFMRLASNPTTKLFY